jgi:hypothetical protein
MTTAPIRAPFGVRFLSILLYVGAILDIIAGIVLITQRNDTELLDTIDATSSDVTTYGVLAIVMGVIVLLIASALRRGSNWARLLVGVIAVVRVVGLIWVTIGYHRVHWYDSLAPTVIYVLVAGYLFFDDDARSFYRRASR